MVEKAVENRYQWKSSSNQYIAVLTVSLLNMLAGIGNGWMTPMVPILMADDTPVVSGPLSHEEISWISSSFSMGSTLGGLLFTWLTVYVDSKRSTAYLTIPAFGFIFYIYYGYTYVDMIIGRIFAGLVTGAVQSTVVIYTAEIANDNVRGKFGSFGQLSRYVGTLLCFVVSTYLGYEYIPIVSLILPIMFIIIFIFLPNTPQFYLRRNRIEEAKKALKFYKGCNGATAEESIAIAAEFERIKELAEREKRDKKLQLNDFRGRRAVHGIMNCVLFAIYVNVTANFVLLNYAVPVFEKSGSHLNPSYSTILMAALQICGCICSTQLSDKLGRKYLMTISMIGSAFGQIICALYVYLLESNMDVSAFHWIPVASVLFVLFMASTGIIPLAILSAIELLPTKIRGFGLGLCLFCMSILSIFCLKTFPIWMEAIGLPATLLIYAVCCIFGAIHILVMVPEMKGKPIDDIAMDDKS